MLMPTSRISYSRGLPLILPMITVLRVRMVKAAVIASAPITSLIIPIFETEVIFTKVDVLNFTNQQNWAVVSTNSGTNQVYPEMPLQVLGTVRVKF